MDLEHGAIYKDTITGWIGKCLLPKENREDGSQPPFDQRVDLIGKGPKGSAESKAISDRSSLELLASASDVPSPDFIPNQEV